MASTRVFVKGLPPTLNEADFRKHFAQHQREVTDVKIFPSRRIGYVGYKTPEDASQAVKYFNKTYIRMSRIGVEVARPIEEAKVFKARGKAPTATDPAASSSVEDQTLNKRKREAKSEEQDAKLREFLQVMGPKRQKTARQGEGAADLVTAQVAEAALAVDPTESDDEYEQITQKSKRADKSEQPAAASHAQDTEATPRQNEDGPGTLDAEGELSRPTLSDAEWAKSRTSRLLGLLDDDEETASEEQAPPISSELAKEEEDPQKGRTKLKEFSDTPASIPTPPADGSGADKPQADAEVEAVRASMRLFVRNLPFDATSDDLEPIFAPFNHLDEVHVSRDPKSGLGKGFAYVQFSDPDSAEQAFIAQDGQIFQGRLLHVLPATAKRDTKLDDFELAKLPLKKQQQIKKRREAASSTFNWNALYMNADAVVSTVAQRLGLSKSELLDPTSSDAAVKQAHAETHIIQETRSYFRSQGVDLDSFKRSQRGDTAILVKNIPYDCSRDELRRIFEEHGDIKRFLMPPSGTIAIVEFPNAVQSKAAFAALAFRKVKSSILFLEKAPKDVFSGNVTSENSAQSAGPETKISTSDIKNPDGSAQPAGGSATLFVRNLNFSTTTQQLVETFKALEGFLSARVKTKTDPKKPGQILSMGFGFVEFRTAAQAQTALNVMDGYALEGHKLQIHVSHKGADAAEERRKADAAKRKDGNKTKIIIKNLPFETTKKDVRSLFGAYGQLRSVRVPRKMDRGARGFAFADFTTPKEAQSAMDALRDTHFLGRRLVLDFAAEEPEDAEAEIERMQQKVGAQVNKIALQKLTGVGRKKFSTHDAEAED